MPPIVNFRPITGSGLLQAAPQSGTGGIPFGSVHTSAPILGSGGISINQFPVQGPIAPGLKVNGLPSPSVGTLSPVSRTAPVLPRYGAGTPNVLSSFGQSAYAPVSLRPTAMPLQNHIGERN